MSVNEEIQPKKYGSIRCVICKGMTNTGKYKRDKHEKTNRHKSAVAKASKLSLVQQGSGGAKHALVPVEDRGYGKSARKNSPDYLYRNKGYREGADSKSTNAVTSRAKREAYVGKDYIAHKKKKREQKRDSRKNTKYSKEYKQAQNRFYALRRRQRAKNEDVDLLPFESGLKWNNKGDLVNKKTGEIVEKFRVMNKKEKVEEKKEEKKEETKTEKKTENKEDDSDSDSDDDEFLLSVYMKLNLNKPKGVKLTEEKTYIQYLKKVRKVTGKTITSPYEMKKAIKEYKQVDEFIKKKKTPIAYYNAFLISSRAMKDNKSTKFYQGKFDALKKTKVK